MLSRPGSRGCCGPAALWPAAKATGINAGGQVVGSGHVSETRVRVFLWEGRVATELGTLEGFDVSMATDIRVLVSECFASQGEV